MPINTGQLIRSETLTVDRGVLMSGNDAIKPRSELYNKVCRVEETLDRLERRSDSAHKDGWDKAGVIAQFLSGTVIALVGVMISAAVQEGQRADAERQQFAEYFDHIVEASDATKRASYMGALDVAISNPSDVVRVATSYAVSDPSQEVREEAIKILGRFPGGKTTLERIASGAIFPDRELARAALGQQGTELLVRLSDIDDDGYLFFNGVKVVEAHTGGPGTDTGWVDISKNLRPGSNQLEFRLHNGIYGGWSGRIQISAGEFQYDSTTLARNACPCNADVLRIPIAVEVGKSNKIVRVEAQPVVYL